MKNVDNIPLTSSDKLLDSFRSTSRTIVSTSWFGSFSGDSSDSDMEVLTPLSSVEMTAVAVATLDEDGAAVSVVKSGKRIGDVLMSLVDMEDNRSGSGSVDMFGSSPSTFCCVSWITWPSRERISCDCCSGSATYKR